MTFSVLACDDPLPPIYEGSGQTMQGGTLMINLAGLPFTAANRFAVDLHVVDCPLS